MSVWPGLSTQRTLLVCVASLVLLPVPACVFDDWRLFPELDVLLPELDVLLPELELLLPELELDVLLDED